MLAERASPAATLLAMGEIAANLAIRQAEAREALFRRLSLDAIAVSTDRPYRPALTTFFEARARRLRH